MSAESNSLAALLDIIDSKKKELSSPVTIIPPDDTRTQLPTIHWIKYFDPATQRDYYANALTQITQWERPDGYEDPSNLVDSISSNASFDVKTGSIRMIGTQSYFEKVGRASDRAGRQLETFFDMSTFEQNREDASEKKRKLQNSGIDWKQYKEDKKKKKFRMKNNWLYEND
jgi:hypothetical protein